MKRKCLCCEEEKRQAEAANSNTKDLIWLEEDVCAIVQERLERNGLFF